MDEQYYSTKQMADMLGVSKQRVYRYIKAKHITEAHHEVVKGNTVLMYRYEDFLLIKQGLFSDSASDEVHHEVHQETVSEAVNDALYETVLKQLEVKDQQIQELNSRLQETLKALDQAQQLQAIAEQKVKALEDQQNIVEDTVEEKKGFFARLFGL